MKLKRLLLAGAGLGGLALCAAAQAGVSAAEAARLGKDLTATGATAAGNADGSIPEWIGAKNFDDAIKNQTPASLETLRQSFEVVRAKSPGDFDALLKYVDSFTIDQYPQISKQIDAIIAKLPK
ncbi:MAG: hypothetical protein JOY51_00470, partial [Nevskia sp.]|nr:hypothetical protein [Nevskia sp.]